MLQTTGRIGIALCVASGWMMIPALCQVEARAGSEYDAGFQVVTIKPGDPHPDGSFTSRLANTNVYTTKNAPLSFVILQAYPWKSVFDPSRLKGAPDWVTTDAYDIQAKLEDATAEAWKKISTAEQAERIAPLLREMLVERCKLVAHTVPTEVNGYALVVDKGGFKMKPTPLGGTYPEAMAKRLEKSPDAMIPLPRGGFASAYLPGDTERTFYRISMAELADAVSQPGALVVDQTGLAGSYDFYLSREEPVPGAPITGGDRLKLTRWDQLGLRLKSVKVTVPIVVIDHIERPTPN